MHVMMRDLSECVGEDLTPHLDMLISKITAKMNDRVLRPLILDALGVVEMNGVGSCDGEGEEARKKIKAKCPSYM